MARVMIVDDDMVSRVLLRHLLVARGHDVIEADDGSTAARRFHDDDGVELIISDQEMPTMSGLELRRHLGERLTVPFVLLTGYATGDDRGTSGAAAEVDALLTKPVSAGMVDRLLDDLAL